MKHCDTCHCDIVTPAMLCPLCASPLSGTDEGSTQRAYPADLYNKRKISFVNRVLLFASAMAGFACFATNYFTRADIWWWTIVVTVLVYAWVTVPHALRRGGNVAAKIMWQSAAASIVVVLLDWETGWRGWSVNYVLPALCSVGIVSVFVLVLLNPTNWSGYVLYQTVVAAQGFVPLVLLLTGVATFRFAVLLPTLLSVISLATIFAFGDRSIKNEFKRRLHF